MKLIGKTLGIILLSGSMITLTACLTTNNDTITVYKPRLNLVTCKYEVCLTKEGTTKLGLYIISLEQNLKSNVIIVGE